MILTVLSLVSCSSAPKKPAEITTVRGIGKTQLQLANHQIDQGNYDNAMLYLNDAWNHAVRADDPELRIKVRLTRGNTYLYLGNDTAAEQDWQAALAEAEADKKDELAAAAKIHIARGRLLKAIAGGTSSPALAGEVESSVLNEMGKLKNEQLYIALAWTVAGLAEKEQSVWDKAEKSFANALQIHEKNVYLEQAAYDWYLIASVRSMSGKYGTAVDALMNAVSLDRRAENSYGLGCDWMALGDVYKKMGDTQKAQDAYSRSKEIFESISMVKDADQVKQRMGN